MVHDQVITPDYAIYNSDNMTVMRSMKDNSIDLSIYSPPFATKTGGGLYQYSSSELDLSNSENPEQFLAQYDHMVMEVARLTKPGRISAVHCTDIMNSKTEELWDFPHEIIRIHEKHGFKYKNRITIWKEPLKVRMRTMVRSLMHKLIVEDSTQCFTAMPDYLLIFKRDGQSEVPVTHPNGLTHYAGATPFLPAHEKTYGDYKTFRKKWLAFTGHPSENKLSHLTWQRYASSVWDDIRIDEVLQFQDAREEDDEKHVHPLQLDVIDRCVELWSNPGEVVFTPFMGVGSEVFSPVSMGRKAIGVELKESYFKQAIRNLQTVASRFALGQVRELDFDTQIEM